MTRMSSPPRTCLCRNDPAHQYQHVREGKAQTVPGFLFKGNAVNRLIDVSHVVEHGMVTYRGLPAPIVCDYLSREASRQLYAPGVEFHIGKVEMVANTG